MDVVTLGILMYLLGGVVNIVLPYITAYLDTGERFDYKKVLARVIGAVMGALAIFVVPSFAEGLVDLSGVYDYIALYALSVFMMAYGASSLGNQGKKLGQAVNAKRNS